MYKHFTRLAAALLALCLLSACAPEDGSLTQSGGEGEAPGSEVMPFEADEPELDSSNAESDTSDTQEGVAVDFETYRGSVTYFDGEYIEVEQLPGYNYGYESLRFAITEDTFITPEGMILQENAFVEVSFNGRLTRSYLPQGVAERIYIVANFSEGIIVSGAVLEVSETESGGHMLTVLKRKQKDEDELDIEEVNSQDTILLHVPYGAMESITAADLKAGTEVTAVTTGVAALSMPPQYTVHILLPYRE